jgi:cellulose synthase/poly-beta-1,6-N-acetylglucosamine synthase-like glycosyltransferase
MMFLPDFVTLPGGSTLAFPTDLSNTCINCISTAVYCSSILAVVSTVIVLCIALLQRLNSDNTPYNPIPVFYSFLKWRPVIVTIIFAVGFKSYQNTLLQNLVEKLTSQAWLLAFIALTAFKFVKVFVHTISFYLLTKPARQPLHPTFSPRDITVIVPTVGELDAEFIECIESILANRPNKVIVVTVGLAKFTKAREVCSTIDARHGNNGKVSVLATTEANKRAQLLRGVLEVDTPFIVYSDDHVFWPTTFLKSILAPMEDPQVGIVGTIKHVRRDRSGGFWESFMNYIACLYLERHNFECTATYNLDGGVFVISGRTALVRTSIMQDIDFRKGYLREMWFWGTVGPMKVDDDNYITRWMVNHGWKTVFHNAPDAIMETSLGTTGGVEKFRGQLIRWVRTTWRSNSTSLFAERNCWSVHPWTTYAMFISSFVNIAIIYDPLLIYTLYRSGYTQYMCTLLLAILVSKLIKPIEHMRREPQDLWVMLPLGLLFGYVHSLFKIWAFFTARNIGWSGRKGIK